ncbi:MAG: tail fiber domain-containing protein [Bacteroidetes bacterium]|nr:tail fiber domain-containing protein [Bacteroidota bacterium]
MKKILLQIFAILIVCPGVAQVKIFPGGSTSIGSLSTPATSFKLHVRGNSVFTDSVFTGNSAAFIRGHNANSAADTPDYTWWGNDQTGFFHPDRDIIGFSTGATERMRLTEMGNLLIGGFYDGGYRTAITSDEDLSALSTATTFSFDNGYAHASYVNRERTKNWVVVYNDSERFFVYGNGNVWSYSNYYYSDSVLKENIVPLSSALSKILLLRGVQYNFKAEVLANPQDSTTVISPTPPPLQLGLIAEEIANVLPEVVATNDKGIMGINYTAIVPVLIEAIKEQQLAIDSLKIQLQDCCNKSVLPGGSGNRIIQGTIPPENSSIKTARLDQNTPNPFHLQTKISYYLPETTSDARLIVFDMQGILKRSFELTTKGESSLIINGGEFPPGMYLYSLLVDGNEINTYRMILTK